MKLILFLLTIIKNKTKNILFLEKRSFIEDEKLENFSGVDDRWKQEETETKTQIQEFENANKKNKNKNICSQNDVNDLKSAIALMYEHNYKYELLKTLQNNHISILNNLHYVRQYNSYHNTYLYNISLIPNLLSCGLKTEFDDFL